MTSLEFKELAGLVLRTKGESTVGYPHGPMKYRDHLVVINGIWNLKQLEVERLDLRGACRLHTTVYRSVGKKIKLFAEDVEITNHLIQLTILDQMASL